MTIVIDRPLQSYPARAQPYSISRTIPAIAVNINRLKISLSDAGDWPTENGDVGRITLVFPGGEVASFTQGGGIVRDKQGNILTSRSVEFSRSNGTTGEPIPFATGIYRLDFEVFKTVSTAVLVEYFR